MKIQKLLISISFCYIILQLTKYTFLLFFLLIDNDIYYLQNINTNSFVLKLGLINDLPIYLGVLYILTDFVIKLYKRRKLDFLSLFSLILSLTLYKFFDFRTVFFFIDNWKLRLLLSYVVLILIIIIIIIKRKHTKLTKLAQV